MIKLEKAIANNQEVILMVMFVLGMGWKYLGM